MFWKFTIKLWMFWLTWKNDNIIYKIQLMRLDTSINVITSHGRRGNNALNVYRRNLARVWRTITRIKAGFHKSLRVVWIAFLYSSAMLRLCVHVYQKAYALFTCYRSETACYRQRNWTFGHACVTIHTYDETYVYYFGFASNTSTQCSDIVAPFSIRRPSRR